MGNVSRVKINQDSEHYLRDESAIKKIIFNKKEYTTSVEKNGAVEIEDPFIEELKLHNILIKNFAEYGDSIESLSSNNIYIVKERDFGELNYSVFVVDEFGKRIRLTAPSLLFETKDLNFMNILDNKFPRFLTFNSFYESFELRKENRLLSGTDALGNEYDESEVPTYIYNVVDKDDDNFERTQYVVFKAEKDGKEYFVKQYVKENLFGVFILMNENSAFVCLDENDMKKNEFARQVEVSI